MKFTTPCFVRVEDAEKRKELRQWLSHIGYKNLAGCETHVVVYGNGTALWMEMQGRTNEVFAKEFYDCGTSVELFKALAAMTDEYDAYQYFTDGVEFHQMGPWIMPWYMEEPKRWHKATAEEIIEHFKTKEK